MYLGCSLFWACISDMHYWHLNRINVLGEAFNKAGSHSWDRVFVGKYQQSGKIEKQLTEVWKNSYFSEKSLTHSLSRLVQFWGPSNPGANIIYIYVPGASIRGPPHVYAKQTKNQGAMVHHTQWPTQTYLWGRSISRVHLPRVGRCPSGACKSI